MLLHLQATSLESNTLIWCNMHTHLSLRPIPVNPNVAFTFRTQDAEFFEAKKARGGRNGPGGGGYGNGRPSPGPPPRRPAAPPVNELDEGGDVTDAAIAAMARGALIIIVIEDNWKMWRIFNAGSVLHLRKLTGSHGGGGGGGLW